MPSGPIKTALTETFSVQHPIMLAGMNVAAGPKLAAAVTNAGGLGVIGGLGYTPKVLRQQIREIKDQLPIKTPLSASTCFFRKSEAMLAKPTSYDYTKGQLPELLDVIIDEKAALFVCAVGVPPKSAVEKLHKAGIPIMNMVGHPKHVAKALEAGVDIICAQGGEGGGHTGHVPTSILIPACVDAVKGHKSPLTGKPVFVVAAGGIFDGRGLAAALMWGAQGVWVGTSLKKAGHEDIMRTLIFTGRPLNVYITDYIRDWETKRQAEIKELINKGIIPHEHELEKHPEKSLAGRRFLMGNVAAIIKDVLPAKTIVDNMVSEALDCISRANGMVGGKPRL
ncbi:Nitronate monooxygenase [Rhizoctonia solani]|uniref:Nitronate monooxygenase n=1 Tax=Rhizoctonia solani TaxID=456999 RepID=A0A8H7I6M9_9AGAM|nr:Nitronate monooxygenase [Rhizoctonia solani]